MSCLGNLCCCCCCCCGETKEDTTTFDTPFDTNGGYRPPQGDIGGGTAGQQYIKCAECVVRRRASAGVEISLAANNRMASYEMGRASGGLVTSSGGGGGPGTQLRPPDAGSEFGDDAFADARDTFDESSVVGADSPAPFAGLVFGGHPPSPGAGAGVDLSAEATRLLRQHLSDCSRAVLFDATGRVLGATCDVNRDELPPVAVAMDNFETALRNGIKLEGQRYEVHRHYPPLMYGRWMRENEPENTEGIAVLRLAKGHDRLFVLVTYRFPALSARIIPRLVEFSLAHLRCTPA